MTYDWRDYTAFSLFPLVMLCAICGNGLVIAVRCTSKRAHVRSAYKTLLFLLAIVDLYVGTTFALDIAWRANDKKWPLPAPLCRVVLPTYSIATTLAVGLMTVMAYERYRGTCHPLIRGWTRKSVYIVSAVLCSLSLVFFIPYIVALRLDAATGNCAENHSVVFRKVYTVFLFVAVYVVPLSLIGYFHYRIIQALHRHGRLLRSQQMTISVSSDGGRVDRKKLDDAVNRKMVNVLSSIVVVFAVLTVPTQLFFLFLDFQLLNHLDVDLANVLLFLIHFSHAHCAVNPIIYSVLDPHFRADVKEMFGGRRERTNRHYESSLAAKKMSVTRVVEYE